MNTNPEGKNPVMEFCIRHQTAIYTFLVVSAFLLLALLAMAICCYYIGLAEKERLAQLATKQTPKITGAALHVMRYSSSLKPNYRQTFPKFPVPCTTQEVAHRCKHCQPIHTAVEEILSRPRLGSGYGVFSGIRLNADGRIMNFEAVTRAITDPAQFACDGIVRRAARRG